MKLLSLFLLLALAPLTSLAAPAPETAYFPNVVVATNLSAGAITNLSLTPSRLLATDANKKETSVSTTGLVDGTGSAVTVGSGLSLSGAAGAQTLDIANPLNVSDLSIATLTLPSLTPLKLAGIDSSSNLITGNLSMWTNTAGIFTGDATKVVGGNGELVSVSGNWNISGTTNSTLEGTSYQGAVVATNSVTIGSDVILASDSSNTLGLKNGTNSQRINISGTFNDSTNYRRGYITDNNSGAFTIGSEGQGTGATGNLIQFATDGSIKWAITNSGHILAYPDNTYDIGASGAYRVRNGYFGTSVNCGTTSGTYLDSANVGVAASGILLWRTRSYIQSPADGTIELSNGAQNDFSLLQLGGRTTNFPALKRIGTNLVARLASDTADTCYTGAGFGSSNVGTITTAATGATNTLAVNVVLYVTSASSAALTDNAGTTEFSGVAISAFTPIRLQPGGKFTGTAITYATGTASHAW